MNIMKKGEDGKDGRGHNYTYCGGCMFDDTLGP